MNPNLVLPLILTSLVLSHFIAGLLGHLMLKWFVTLRHGWQSPLERKDMVWAIFSGGWLQLQTR